MQSGTIQEEAPAQQGNQGRRARPRQPRAAHGHGPVQEAVMDPRQLARLIPQLGTAGVVALILWTGLSGVQESVEELRGDVRELRVLVADLPRDRERWQELAGRVARLEERVAAIRQAEAGQ